MLDSRVHQQILAQLNAAEAEHNVTILFACESGSRAWGFASPDSDYDVRFIYAHPRDWYLSFDVHTRRDVIEYPIIGEIDCSGWDLRKALHLFTRSNGALLEWLVSPIRYIERGPLRRYLAELAPQTINQTALCFHYSHMARRNAREYLFKDQVRIKKYFYVLRPLLAIRYLEQCKAPPPIEFNRLVQAVAPSRLMPAIEQLLALKQNLPEAGMGKPIPIINQFIQDELNRHGETFTGQGRPDLATGDLASERLNAIFREIVTSA